MAEMKIKMRKGLWSPDEDEKLSRCIAMYMNGSWSDIARKAGLHRCGKSCRRRWMNHLRPDLKRGRFTPAEISRVVDLHNALGNRWSEIAGHLVGRTDNDVKNLWNTQIKRQFKTLQIHPNTLTVTHASTVDIVVGDQVDAGDTSITSATSQSISTDMPALMEEPATIAKGSAQYQNKVNTLVDCKRDASTIGNPCINIKSIFTFPFRCDESEHQVEPTITEDVVHEDMNTRGALKSQVPSNPIMQNMHEMNIPHALSSSNLSKIATLSHELATSTSPHRVKHVAHNVEKVGKKGALHFPPIQLHAHEQPNYKDLWHMRVPMTDESTPLHGSIIQMHNSVVGADSGGTTSVSSMTSVSSDVEDYANSCAWWSTFEETDFQLPEPAECWQSLDMLEL